MKKQDASHTHPFADLSRYGVDAPFLSDEEISALSELRQTPAWMVLWRVRAHLLTVNGRKAINAAKLHSPEAFKFANLADGIEIYMLVLDSLTNGHPVPDVTASTAVGDSRMTQIPEDDL